MKKLLRLIPILLVAILAGFALTACGDDDEPASAASLPQPAKTFLDTFFPKAQMMRAVKDKDEYEVTLTNGFKIEFTHAGEWTDVDAPAGLTIPSGFYPAEIDTYVVGMDNGQGINEISRDSRGYEVELTNGLDLRFDLNGVFVAYDF